MKVLELKTFVGAEDYETSKAFYQALGFTLNWENAGLGELQLGEYRFLLQDYYQKDWCENTMLHMSVDNADEWYQHITSVIDEGDYGAARVTAPKLEDYGARVSYVFDPSGVLWHFAEHKPA